MAKKYDVIVVGGGPGGSVAAITAVRKGLKVLVLERASNIGEKNVSGFGLTAKAWRDFDFIRDMDIPMRKGTFCGSHFCDSSGKERLYIRLATTKRVEYKEATFYAHGMYRIDFDKYLAKVAKNVGAEFKMATVATDVLRKGEKIVGVVTDNGEEIVGDIVIGADGVVSLMAIKSGLRKKWNLYDVMPVYNVEFSAPEDKLDAVIGEEAFTVFMGLKTGPIYIAFGRDGFHVGGSAYPMGAIAKQIEAGHSAAVDVLKSLENEAVQKLIKACGGTFREWQVHPITWCKDLSQDIYTDGLMLVGDAAQLPEPYLAEGVWHAMYSGKLAAEVAEEAIKKGDTSKRFLREYYERLLASPLGQEFVGGQQIRDLFGLWASAERSEELAEFMIDLMQWGFMYQPMEPKGLGLRKLKSIFLENTPLLLSLLKIYVPLLVDVYSKPLSEKIQEFKEKSKSSGR